MAMPTCGRIRFLTTMVSGMLAIAASPASADPITTPLSGFNVELPAGWKLGAATTFGPGMGAQYLNHAAASTIVLSHSLLVACQAGAANERPAWLPPGWTVQGEINGMMTLCSERAGFPIVVMGELDGRPAQLELLAAFDRAWKSSPAAQLFEVVILPRSQLTLRMPEGLHVLDTAGTRSDRLQLAGPRGTAPYLVAASSDACEAAFAKLYEEREGDDFGAMGAATVVSPSSAPAPTGWRRWDRGSQGEAAYCAPSTDASPTVIVLAPSAAEIQQTGANDPTEDLLDALRSELLPVAATGAPVPLPATSWRVRVPGDWRIMKAPDADGLLDASGNALIVVRGTGACAQLLPTGRKGSMPFDPAWMPAGWRAAVDTASLHIVLCADVDGGAVQAAIPPRKMPRRRELIAVLASLRGDNVAATSAVAPLAERSASPSTSVSSYVPAPARRGPVLPFPLRLSYQTVGLEDERGHGLRLGLEHTYGDHSLSVGVRGEVGYDTLTKLGHDVQLRLVYPLFESSLSVVGSAGHDAWGNREDMPAVPGGWYGGLGLSFVNIFERSVLRFAGHYLWRTSEPALDMTEPDHETRFEVSLMHRLGPLRGVTGELRTTGDATTFLLGAHVRL